VKAIRKLAPILGATSLALAILAGGQASAQGTGSVKGEGKDLVMFTITASNVYGANQIKGAEKEAAELGYKLQVFQNNFSQPEQDQQVQQYIASGATPAAIIFWPWVADAAINDVRQLSKVAPVIQLTQEPNEQSWPYVKAYSGANQILIGETLGQMMLKARDAAKAAGMKFKSDGGNLLVFQHPEGEKTGTERMKGFMKVTESAPFNIIHVEYGPNSPETGYEIGSQVIPKYKGQFDFLFVSNQQAANGIIRALKENGITPGKDVYIVSGDCSGSLDAVKNGETFGTGIQPAAVEGALAVRTAAKYIAAGKTEGDVIQLDVTADAPAIDDKAPAKFNYMPHAPAIGADGVANTKIWGYSADEICAG
jgi:ABC-type sugar transport system substrate-binding protein